LDEELQIEKERQRQIAERQRQWCEEARLRQEDEQRRQEEEKRVKQLQAMVNAWHQSERIRAFLATLGEARRAHGTTDHDGRMGEWMNWAARYANSIDPLKVR
jgi:hypothetical protein